VLYKFLTLARFSAPLVVDLPTFLEHVWTQSAALQQCKTILDVMNNFEHLDVPALMLVAIRFIPHKQNGS
jgi:hypothetical protein